jgi:transposase
MPHDLPPCYRVYQQTRAAGWRRAVREAMVEDLRLLLRGIKGRKGQPSAAIFDSRVMQSTPESGQHSGYDGARRRKGSKVHVAVDTLGHLLTLLVTPANEQDRAQVGELASRVQDATGQSVELAFVDQGYTGDDPAQAAASRGIQLEVIKLAEAKRGFVLLPRRWVVERSFAWVARFRRLARDYERLPATVAGLYLVAFACLMRASVDPVQLESLTGSRTDCTPLSAVIDRGVNPLLAPRHRVELYTPVRRSSSWFEDSRLLTLCSSRE